jgi:hypothetical protein
MDMLTKIALALALTLGVASAASAATKHPIHHHRGAVVQQQAAPAGNSAYGYVAFPNGSGNQKERGTNFLSSGCGLDGC